MDEPDLRSFDRVMEWLYQERVYQLGKWDYESEDIAHAIEGLGEDSWFWQQLTNYTGRVRVFGLEGDAAPLGVQALLKAAATLMGQAEALLRGEVIDDLPAPGTSSGNIEPWR